MKMKQRVVLEFAETALVRVCVTRGDRVERGHFYLEYCQPPLHIVT